ncbi:MAG: lysine--tRNA ligase [Candidatus Bathyarchaeota archaeon]
MHWSEVIAQEIKAKKHEPFVVASGITTSGPIHMGTLCEFLYPSAIAKYLKDEGHQVEFIFIGDLMDAFDNVPKPLENFTSLNSYLGRPLCDVPDPFDCCNSYGDHFLNETSELMKDLEISSRIIRANDLNRAGKYDAYAIRFYKEKPKIKEIALRTSKLSGISGLPDWTDIVMPICECCGRISTTRVTDFDGYVVNYVCDKDVKYTKGCGYRSKMHISDHRYKLFWRLDWPSRQDFLNVSAELAGIDHHTLGGSWDTAVAIHKEVFNKMPPIGHRFGFVLLHGKKYSKSKGIGLDVKELLSFVPPPLIKYKLFRADIGENKEFDPSGNALIRLYEEYGQAADIFEKSADLHRAEYKMSLAYALSTDTRRWRVDFADLLTYYQIYGDWERLADKLGDREGIAYLKKYVENWIKEEYLPEEYVFRFKPTKAESMYAEILAFSEKLNPSMSGEDVHNLVYFVAKEYSVGTSALFKALYQSLISKDHGPRLGKLVVAIGVDQVNKTLINLYS